MQNIKKIKWASADVRDAILIFTLAVVNFSAGYLLASAQTASLITNAN
jgi:hypothetical protein